MLISEEQSGYVEGRQILDGVVVAIETIHSMASSKDKAMFIKLDMAKAYDRVRWSFLQKVGGMDSLDYELCKFNFFFNFNQWEAF